MLGKWVDPMSVYTAPRKPRYAIVHRYGKWRVIDTAEMKVLVKVNSRELAETYLRLLQE
jgi:hypothetical protein